MRTILAAALTAATIALGGGCAVMAPADIPVSEKLSPAAKQVQTIINEANVTLTAAANVISQNVADGIWTKPEAQSYLDQVKDYAKKVDAAQVMLDTGDVLNAKTQAELLSRLIVTLHKEVASRSRK